MISTFVRIWAPDNLRLGMAISTVARWQLEPMADLTLLICEDSRMHESWLRLKRVIIPVENFAQHSIRTAEEMAETEYYSVSDDDMLIYGPKFIQRCLEVAHRHPEYGIICASPTNDYMPANRDGNPEIQESHAVGGPGLVRRGVMTDFPPISNQQYAGHIDKQFREQGFKMGYMRDVKYLHLGLHFSFSSPPHCDGY